MDQLYSTRSLDLGVPDSRRESPRGSIALPIRIEGNSGLPLRTAIRDISTKGLALYSDQDIRKLLPLKVVISVPFSLAQERHIEVRFDAEVLRMEDAIALSGKRYFFVLRLLARGELSRDQLQRLH